MPELVTDCPRCNSQKISFDVTQAFIFAIEYGWQNWYEAFSICRHCNRATIFILSESVDGNYKYVHEHGLLNITGALNAYVTVERYVSLRDVVSKTPPEHVPPQIESVFREGATCLSVGCYNASATMFRLCIDLVTRDLLPEQDENGLNQAVRWKLGLRLTWLFDHGRLPEAFRELASCVREDGNDGAHVGTLTLEDAEDLFDFTYVLLERIFTEPEKLKLAKVRRDGRRSIQGV